MSERPQSSPERIDAAAPAGEQQEPTVGTGSSLGIGCMVLMLLIVVALAVVFFLPYFRR